MDRPDCTICWDPLLDDTYALIACSHVFHRRCIGRWLKIQLQCPFCRQNVGADVLSDVESRTPAVDNEYFELDEPDSPLYFPGYIVATPFARMWSEVQSRLVDDGDIMESYTSDEREREPTFYRTMTLEFLKNLSLADDQYDEIILFKRREGKRALCDAVNRMKVFLTLNERFLFTSVADMLHKCREMPCSVADLEKVFEKYTRMNNNVPVRDDAQRRRGCVYDFFGLPEPERYNRAALALNKSFRITIYNLYGVYLFPVRPDEELESFYNNFPHNSHNVLHFAKLRHERNFLDQQMDKLKRSMIGCKRRHE